MIKVIMRSDKYGTDVFEVGTIKGALDGIARLVKAVEEMQDGIERVIGIVVNPRAETEDEPE